MDRYKEGYNDCNREWRKKIEETIKKLDIDIARNERRKIEHTIDDGSELYSFMPICYSPEIIKTALQDLLKKGEKNV